MAKLKVVRVVTASYVVPWHLDNTLRRIPADFEVTVVGQGVSANRDAYLEIHWVDIDLGRKISLLADILSFFSLCRFLFVHKPDIVHSIMPKAGLLSALAGFVCRVPVRMHTFTGQIWIGKKPVARYFLYLLDRMINALNTLCLADSPSQATFLYKHQISAHGKPLPVLGQGSLSGVDLERFDQSRLAVTAAKMRAKLGISAQDFVFAFIARKSRDKGALDIIAAFAGVASKYPHARLLFIGPDESDGELQRLQAGSPAMFNNVIGIGAVEHHEDYLAVTDVICLPSYREGFGSIVIDAAAAGVPAIGADIVGLVDSIEADKTGLLFSSGNIDQLANAMRAMIENRQRCKDMGAAARQRVEAHFSADHMYSLLRDFYLTQAGTVARK